jgi:hypothetical protein
MAHDADAYVVHAATLPAIALPVTFPTSVPVTFPTSVPATFPTPVPAAFPIPVPVSIAVSIAVVLDPNYRATACTLSMCVRRREWCHQIGIGVERTRRRAAYIESEAGYLFGRDVNVLVSSLLSNEVKNIGQRSGANGMRKQWKMSVDHLLVRVSPTETTQTPISLDSAHHRVVGVERVIRCSVQVFRHRTTQKEGGNFVGPAIRRVLVEIEQHQCAFSIEPRVLE